MKKLIALSLALVMTLSVAACGSKGASSAPAKFKAGSYQGTAKGFGGDLSVGVKLTADKIESVTVTAQTETDGIGSIAVESIPAKMVETQSLAVDAVSGATITSKAILEAATAAFTAAGADIAALSAKDAAATPAEVKEETLEADVVIIGAGGAGLVSAIEATQAGKKVLVLEKMAFAGGNSVKATGGMNAAETSVQKKLNIEDTVDVFVSDTMTGGKDINNKELVTAMAKNSAAAIDWLETIKAPLPEVSFSGGATNKRIHRPEGGAPVGSYLIEKFLANAKELGIEIKYNTKANEIIIEDGKAVGVKATAEGVNYTVKAKAVILATGGFGANEAMYTQYRPELKGFVTTNTPGATGDGIAMAEKAGAALVDMEQIQIHPTVHQETSIMITESVRGGGAILANQGGKRFTNEMGTRDVVSADVIAQEGSSAYLIFDQKQREALSAIEGYIKAGITTEAATVEALAEAIGTDKTALTETVTTWNKAVADKKDAAFARATGMDVDVSVGPFYAIKIAPGVHHTMGGVKIDVNTQVLNAAGAVIPGLFAAGEVTGGIHGANRIGGNAVTDFVVFGRQAAVSAVAYVG